MTAEQFLFFIFAIATCGGALAVVVAQDVVRMAFWLIVSLGSTAGIFFLLRADFVGAAQLLIYVGGTVVLLIFGIMLTASGPYLKIATSPGELVTAGCVGLLFLSMIYSTVYVADWSRLKSQPADPTAVAAGYNPSAEGNTVRPIGMKLIGVSLEDLGQSPNGKLSTGYFLPFEIVSVHLLVVLVGAAYLARAKRRVDSQAASVK